MRNFGPTNPHSTAFAPKQWLYQKEPTGMESSKMYCPSRCRYRTYHCVAANYPISWGLYRVQKGNMRNFWPTNPHGTSFAPKQWLYEKEATGMESSKMYCPSRCRYRTYQCVAVNYPVSWGSRKEICKTLGLTIPIIPRLHQSSYILKRKLWAWRGQKCIVLVGAHTVPTSARPQTTPLHGG